MMLARRGDDAVVWADRALVAARTTGDDWLAAQAMVERASASTFVIGRTREEGSAALGRAYEAALAVGDPVLTCRALSNGLNLLVAAQPRRRRDPRRAARADGVGRLRQARRAAARLSRRRRRVRSRRPAGLPHRPGRGRAVRRRLVAPTASQVDLVRLPAGVGGGPGRDAAAFIDDIDRRTVGRGDCEEELPWLRLRAAGQLGDAADGARTRGAGCWSCPAIADAGSSTVGT